MWLPIDSVPRDGSKFDAWCVEPDTGTMGVRFTDVQMRGDMTGFGVMVFRQGGGDWEYLEQDGPIFPKWKITHWMRRPEPPASE